MSVASENSRTKVVRGHQVIVYLDTAEADEGEAKGAIRARALTASGTVVQMSLLYNDWDNCVECWNEKDWHPIMEKVATAAEEVSEMEGRDEGMQA